MDPTTCSVCVIAASAGGVVGGYVAGGSRGRNRGRRARRGSRTMRTWPGGRRDDPRPPVVGQAGPRQRESRPGAGLGRPFPAERDGPSPGHDDQQTPEGRDTGAAPDA